MGLWGMGFGIVISDTNEFISTYDLCRLIFSYTYKPSSSQKVPSSLYSA